MPIINKQKIIIISGIVLGLAAIALTKLYIEQQRKLAQEQAKRAFANIQANQIAVLVAKRDIPRGTALNSAMLETAIVPKQYVQPQVATSLDRVDGMVSIASINKGEQITLSKLMPAKQAGGLAAVTPAGKRAITINVDNISSLVGMINPGDYVDVSYVGPVPIQGPDGKQSAQVIVIPLFQNVLVLAVGQETGTLIRKDERRYKESSKEDASPLITLALTPKDASLIAFLQEQGRIRLSLRSPADAKVEPLPPANWDTVFQYIMPLEQKEAAEKGLKPVAEYVEIYRGLNKERVPLSK